jgi:hypothetical protein
LAQSGQLAGADLEIERLPKETPQNKRVEYGQLQISGF